MSYRALKKLGLGNNDIPKVEESTDDEQPNVSNSSKCNIFGLLGNESVSDNDIEDDFEFLNMSDETASDAVRSINKRRRKKKKRKSKAQNTICTNEVTEINDILTENLTEENVPGLQIENNHLESKVHVQSTLLNVQLRFLRYDNELKSKFGAKVVNDNVPENRTVSQKLASVFGRMKLTQPKTDWPVPKETGLSMEFIEKNETGSYFKYKYNDHYKVIEHALFRLARSPPEIQRLSVIGEEYHVNSLIYKASIYMDNGDHSEASALIERALYYLELKFVNGFSILKSDCKLDYVYPENRSFFIALFKHILYIGARSCDRTALELTKLLLSVDPSDPLACILFIDYYALRANEYTWLLKFIDEFDGTRNLLQLPNFQFSQALAYFYLGKHEEADECLINAILYCPYMVNRVASKAFLKLNSVLAHHYYFLPTSYLKDLKSFDLLTTLYVERNFHLWKQSHVLKWFERIVNKVIELVDMTDERTVQYRILKSKRFRCDLPLNIKRHFYLCDYNNLLDVQNRQVLYDPFPPPVPHSTSSKNTFKFNYRDTIGNFFASLNPQWASNSSE